MCIRDSPAGASRRGPHRRRSSRHERLRRGARDPGKPAERRNPPDCGDRLRTALGPRACHAGGIRHAPSQADCSDRTGAAARPVALSDFRLFLAGRFFAALALQMQSVAIGWYLYDRTGDAMALAYAGLAVFLPIALFSLPGGDVADRVDRRWILGTAHIAQAAGSATLVLLTLFKAEETWPFYAVLSLAGTARAFSAPAVQSLLPFLVTRERFPAAVAWSSSAQQSATVLGPAVGGLIYLAGAPASFAACSVASLAVATCWFSIRARGGVATAAGGSAVSRLLQGLRYLRVNRV